MGGALPVKIQNSVQQTNAIMAPLCPNIAPTLPTPAGKAKASRNFETELKSKRLCAATQDGRSYGNRCVQICIKDNKTGRVSFTSSFENPAGENEGAPHAHVPEPRDVYQ